MPNMLIIYRKAIPGLNKLYEIKHVEIFDESLEQGVRNYYANNGYTEATQEQVDSLAVLEQTTVGYIK